MQTACPGSDEEQTCSLGQTQDQFAIRANGGLRKSARSRLVVIWVRI